MVSVNDFFTQINKEYSAIASDIVFFLRQIDFLSTLILKEMPRIEEKRRRTLLTELPPNLVEARKY